MGRYRWTIVDEEKDYVEGTIESFALHKGVEFIEADEQESNALALRSSQSQPRRRACSGSSNDSSPSYQHPQPYIVFVPRQMHREKSWFSSLVRTVLILVVVPFAFWVHRDGPPAPPPISASSGAGNNNWKKFISDHGQQLLNSTMALFVLTPAHLFHWWIQSLHLDWDNWARGQNSELPVIPFCSLSIPDNLLENLLKGTGTTSRIVGQLLAAQTIAEAINNWNLRSSRSFPMIILLSGQAGSGKRTLARTLTRLISKCNTQFGQSYSGVNERMLLHPHVNVMYGRHYGPDNDINGLAESKAKLLLQNELLRYKTNTKPDAVSFVIIEGVEEMGPRILTWLISEVTFQSDEHENYVNVNSPANAADGMIPQPLSLRNKCARMIIFLTSSTIGTRATMNWLRHYGPDSLGLMDENSLNLSPKSQIRLPPGFDLDMAHDIDSTLGDKAYSKLNAVVPFVPFTESSLLRILCDQICNYVTQDSACGRSARIDEAFARELLRHHVEFLSWNRRLDGDIAETILSFSSAGARPISLLIKRLIAAISSACSLKSHPDKVIMFELDEEVTHDKHFLVKWCDEHMSVEPTCVDEHSFCLKTFAIRTATCNAQEKGLICPVGTEPRKKD